MALKPSLIVLTFVAAVVSGTLASAAAAQEPTCEVEVWRWYHSPFMESFGVEGVASCRESRIAMIVFDMDGETPTFVGVGDGFIEHRAFTVLLRDVPHPPVNPVIEFTITPFED